VKQPLAGPRTRPAPASTLDPTRSYELVVLTNCGSFTIRLDPSQSPHAAASLVSLARSKYFDRTVVTRIIPGVLVEAGDPTATGTGGPGYTTIDPPPPGAAYAHGIVGMAQPAGHPRGAAGSLFFIVTAHDVQRPPGYAIVGRVVNGLDVVELIGTFGIKGDLTNDVSRITGLPSRIIEIERVRVVTTA
jgi:peptidyl-prolyl cis-trans isomerase B (cyclophilin B)